MSHLHASQGVLKTSSQVDRKELMKIRKNGLTILQIRRTVWMDLSMLDKQLLSFKESKCILKKKEELIKSINIKNVLKSTQLQIREKQMSIFQINFDHK